MDIVSNIELNLKQLLEGIDGTEQSTGYTFHSTTGTVNIEDEILSRSMSGDPNDINHEIWQNDTETGLRFAIGQNALTNRIPFLIISRCKNIATVDNPMFAIKSKMNQVLSDIKHSIYMNNTLNGSCSHVTYVSSMKSINDDNNRIYTGELETVISVEYSQSGQNPDLLACI